MENIDLLAQFEEYAGSQKKAQLALLKIAFRHIFADVQNFADNMNADIEIEDGEDRYAIKQPIQTDTLIYYMARVLGMEDKSEEVFQKINQELERQGFPHIDKHVANEFFVKWCIYNFPDSTFLDEDDPYGDGRKDTPAMEDLKNYRQYGRYKY